MATQRDDTPRPPLPAPIGEDGLVGDNQGGSNERRPLHDRDDDTTEPGRPMSPDERLDEALQETFPTSDPIAPSRIDGPGR